MVTFVNSFGATVMHFEAEARSAHFLNQAALLTVKVYLKNSKGFGRQSFSMTWVSSLHPVLFLHLQFFSVWKEAEPELKVKEVKINVKNHRIVTEYLTLIIINCTRAPICTVHVLVIRWRGQIQLCESVQKQQRRQDAVESKTVTDSWEKLAGLMCSVKHRASLPVLLHSHSPPVITLMMV